MIKINRHIHSLNTVFLITLLRHSYVEIAKQNQKDGRTYLRIKELKSTNPGKAANLTEEFKKANKEKAVDRLKACVGSTLHAGVFDSMESAAKYAQETSGLDEAGYFSHLVIEEVPLQGKTPIPEFQPNRREKWFRLSKAGFVACKKPTCFHNTMCFA